MVSEDAGETWQRSLRADYMAISAQIRLGGDLLRAGSWETTDVPSEVRGGRSASVDSRGRLVVGTAGSGVWVWEPL